MTDPKSKRSHFSPLDACLIWVNNSEPGRGPVAMNLMCLQTSVMQELYASFEDGARPVEDFFIALKALKCTWPTGGKLMIQARAGEPERTKTWFSHQMVRSLPPLGLRLLTALSPVLGPR